MSDDEFSGPEFEKLREKYRKPDVTGLGKPLPRRPMTRDEIFASLKRFMTENNDK
jgi:hypothetical protein